MAAVAVICGSFVWLVQSFTHMFGSYVSASAGTLGPHFAISQIGRMTLLTFTFGIVFLAFDIRQRDVRDRIGATIDVRPMTNLELITGRLFGIVFLFAVPAMTLIVLMCGFGLIAEVFNFGFGSVIEPVSVVAFLFWDLLPNLLFWGSLTMLVAVIVRFRMLVVLIMLVLVFGYYYLSSQIPFFLASALATYTGLDSLPSAIAPQFFNTDIVFNRLYVILLTIGMLGLTSVLYPRQAKLQERQFFAITGSSAIVIAIFGIYALVNSKLLELEQVEEWALLHKQFQTHSDTNIESISGEVEIFPGRSIRLDLVLSVSSVTSDPVDIWLFSLNHRYKIDTLELNGEETKDYDFEDGLLSVPNHNMGTTGAEIRIVAKGVPDPMFAYLDSSLSWKDMNYVQALAARQFGTKSYIFHPGFVVLVPGVSWFPSSGSAYGQSNLESRPQDFYHVDLHVTVPKNWIVAGPGSRTLTDEKKRTQYRFKPKNPVSEVALVASNFERRSFTIEDTKFELLISKKHAKNLKLLEPVVPALKEWIEERMTQARKLGISYPYDTLSFVEVPLPLRTYGGGWKMDSVYSPPGIQMIRESGLPIARFDYAINSQDAELTEDEEKLSAFVLQLLLAFFENDFEGGSPLLNLGRNLVSHQTKPSGSGAVAIEYLVGEIANELVMGTDGYFSIHTALEGNRVSDLRTSVMWAGGDFGAKARLEKLEFRKRFSNRPSIWEKAIGTPLTSFDLEQDTMNSYHALILKVDALKNLVLDVADENDVGSFLRDLIAQYRGGNYTEEDLHNTALNAGVDFRDLLGNWLHSAEIPGFVVAEPNLERLENPDSDEVVYQSSFFIRNDETVDGFVTVSSGEEGELGFQKSTPFRVPSKTTLQIAIQTIDHPRQVLVHPYFSHNRGLLRVNIVEHDDEIPLTSVSLPHITEVDWILHNEDSIIVDDLDAGFSVIGGADAINNSLFPKWVKYLFGGYDAELETDHGLLELNSAADSLDKNVFESVLWYRDSEASSFGRYRHTYVINFQRAEQTELTYSQYIPTPGKWKLEIHMPAIKRKRYTSTHSPGLGSIFWMQSSFRLANVQLEIKNLGLSNTIEFKPQEAKSGWNDLGLFDLEAGTVDVVLTPLSEGNTIGDAIRWTMAKEEN